MNTNSIRTRLCATFFILLFSLFSSFVYAGTTKVDVCHIPPGNPENFHTISISERAVDHHLAHGDMLGVCNEPEACPCFNADDLAALGDVVSGLCGNDFPVEGTAAAVHTDGSVACSGLDCTESGVLSCAVRVGPAPNPIDEVNPITEVENVACQTLIVQHCSLSSDGPEASAASSSTAIAVPVFSD